MKDPTSVAAVVDIKATGEVAQVNVSFTFSINVVHILHNQNSYSATETKFSYLRFLRNNKVSTSLTNSANFFFANAP